MWDIAEKILNRVIPTLRKDQVIGLDLGASSVKLAQFVKTDGAFILNRLELKEIDPSTEAGLWGQKLSAALKDLLAGLDISRSQFVVTFNDPEADLRVMTVPFMPRPELVEAMKLEAKNFFSAPIETISLDIEPCGETIENGVRKQRIAVGVVPLRRIDEILAVLGALGIRPVSLIPTVWAMQRLAVALAVDDGKARCFVDIGERQTEFLILSGKKLIFHRKIPIGGSDFTQAMTVALFTEKGTLALSAEEAESIKREVGISKEDKSQMIAGKISSNQICVMLRSTVEQLVDEMDRCLGYSREETEDEPIDQLILFGRGSLLKELAPALAEGLGRPVQVGVSLNQLAIPFRGVKPDQTLVPFAAALGAGLSLGKGANFLPPEIKYETQRTLKRAGIQSVATTLLFILIFIYAGMKIQLANYQKRIQFAKQELASFQAALADVKPQILAHNILAKEPYWEDVFKEISDLIPTDVVLTELKMVEGKLQMRGVIYAPEKEALLSEFIQKLENGIFKNVKLVTTNKVADQATSEFELECGID